MMSIIYNFAGRYSEKAFDLTLLRSSSAVQKRVRDEKRERERENRESQEEKELFATELPIDDIERSFPRNQLTSNTSSFICDVVSETLGWIITFLEEFGTFETEKKKCGKEREEGKKSALENTKEKAQTYFLLEWL